MPLPTPWPEERTSAHAAAAVAVMLGFYFVLERVLPTDEWYQTNISSKFSSEFWHFYLGTLSCHVFTFALWNAVFGLVQLSGLFTA